MTTLYAATIIAILTIMAGVVLIFWGMRDVG